MKNGVFRHEDALVYLRLAKEAEDPEERERHLYQALWTFITADVHQELGLKENRRGSEPGQRIDDTQALEVMDFLAVGTGDTRARELARYVVENLPEFVGRVHSEESAIDQLARRWSNRCKNVRRSQTQ